jgi:hypothetical protein
MISLRIGIEDLRVSLYQMGLYTFTCWRTRNDCLRALQALSRQELAVSIQHHDNLAQVDRYIEIVLVEVKSTAFFTLFLALSRTKRIILSWL